MSLIVPRRQMEFRAGCTAQAETREAQRQELEMAHEIVATLLRLYPGHQWGCEVNFEGGICWIALPVLMGPSLRFVIHLSSMSSQPDAERELRKAGGEILERFKLERGRFDPDSFDAARKNRIIDHKTPMPE